MYRNATPQYLRATQRYNGLSEALVTRIVDLEVATGQTVNDGDVCSFNSAGKLLQGCAGDTFPLFATHGLNNAEVTIPGTPAAPATNRAVGLTVLVPMAGVEYATPKYVVANAAAYICGAKLTAGLTADLGRMSVAGTYYSDTVQLGMVTRGIVNRDGTNYMIFVAYPALAVNSNQFAPLGS